MQWRKKNLVSPAARLRYAPQPPGRQAQAPHRRAHGAALISPPIIMVPGRVRKPAVSPRRFSRRLAIPLKRALTLSHDRCRLSAIVFFFFSEETAIPGGRRRTTGAATPPVFPHAAGRGLTSGRPRSPCACRSTGTRNPSGAAARSRRVYEPWPPGSRSAASPPWRWSPPGSTGSPSVLDPPDTGPGGLSGERPARKERDLMSGTRSSQFNR